MRIETTVGPVARVETPLLVLPWCQDGGGGAEPPAPELGDLDEALGGALTRAVGGGDYHARKGETLLLYGGGGEGPERALLVGVGKREDLTAERLRQAGGWAAGRAGELGLSELAVWASTDWLGGAVELGAAARAMVEGVVLGTWRFDELRSRPPEDDSRPRVTEVVVRVAGQGGLETARAGAEAARVAAGAQNYARELAIRPANIVTPRYLADEARRLGEELGLAVTVLDREAMKKDGMSALLAVAAGSEEEPRFIALEYSPNEGARPLVLVGKGVTFDSGGLSLKTSQGMETMKSDMSGAAAVLGAMRAIAELATPVNVVGLIPAVENLPSGHAVRPGDVISSRSGKTIEVLNTDAEGRLILADALNYAARFDPAAMVDVATLTGACVVALGHHAVALLGSDESLQDEIRAAGERCGERVWPLPLWDDYRQQLKSEVADIKNTGGRAAGTITAAIFLQEFVGSMPWAHLDIAGTAWSEKAGAYQPVGPTGVGVRLLTEWVRGRAG